MDIHVFDTLHTNSRVVTSMIDLSEIRVFTWTFFKQFLVGFFQSYEIPPINQIIENDCAILIFGRFSNILVFGPIPN